MKRKRFLDALLGRRTGPDDELEALRASQRQDAQQRAHRRRQLHELTERFQRVHRSVLDPGVLQDVLPGRARTLPGREGTPAARERERSFRQVAATYAAAIDDASDLGGRARTIDLLGLTWWVPLPRPNEPARVERALGHQDFPFRAIAQTRELALGTVMLDIGANIGRMSIPRIILGDAQVAYCAEPEPLNFACLVRNVRDNHLRGLVLPEQVAIGAVDGTARLARSRTSGGHRVVERAGQGSAREPGSAGPGATPHQDAEARVFGGGPSASGEDDARPYVDVPALKLDSWVDRLGVDADAVSFIKIDAQGSEVHILQGAARMLACRHVAWQIEIDPALIESRGQEVATLLEILGRHFTHFIDLNREAPGERVRPVADLTEALGYVVGQPGGRTDLLLYSGT